MVGITSFLRMTIKTSREASPSNCFTISNFSITINNLSYILDIQDVSSCGFLEQSLEWSLVQSEHSRTNCSIFVRAFELTRRPAAKDFEAAKQGDAVVDWTREYGEETDGIGTSVSDRIQQNLVSATLFQEFKYTWSFNL